MTTEPTGVWAEAIRHLAEAEHLMSLIPMEEARHPAEPATMADPHRRTFEMMRAMIKLDYERRWWDIATRPVRVVVVPYTDPDGNVKVEVRPQT